MSDTRDKAGFTAGPWHVCPHSIYIWGPNMEMIADYDEEERYVARVRGFGAKLPMAANANLIAASPLLYKALERCVRLCEQDAFRLQSTEHEAWADQRLTDVCTALAAARGEKSA